jgi:nucleoid DNA-binding protein
VLKPDVVYRLQECFPEHVKKDLETVVDVTFRAMAEALQEGRRIEIRGVGSFSVTHQKGREFVNPKTGIPTKCPPNRRVVFRPGKDLRARPSSGS